MFKWMKDTARKITGRGNKNYMTFTNQEASNLKSLKMQFNPNNVNFREEYKFFEYITNKNIKSAVSQLKILCETLKTKYDDLKNPKRSSKISAGLLYENVNKELSLKKDKTTHTITLTIDFLNTFGDWVTLMSKIEDGKKEKLSQRYKEMSALLSKFYQVKETHKRSKAAWKCLNVLSAGYDIRDDITPVLDSTYHWAEKCRKTLVGFVADYNGDDVNTLRRESKNFNNNGEPLFKVNINNKNEITVEGEIKFRKK